MPKTITVFPVTLTCALLILVTIVLLVFAAETVTGAPVRAVTILGFPALATVVACIVRMGRLAQGIAFLVIGVVCLPWIALGIASGWGFLYGALAFALFLNGVRLLAAKTPLAGSEPPANE